MALGIAASQPVGVREQFGTMTKPFHPGAAARAGLMSALLAKHGFTARPARSRRRAASCRRYSTKSTGARSPTSSASASRSRSTPTSRSPAASSSIRASTPACSCASARRRAPRIERIELRVHSLVLELTGKKSRARARGQVQRLSRLRRGPDLRPGGRSRIRRRDRDAATTWSRCATGSSPRPTRRSTRPRPTSPSSCADGRRVHVVRRARDRQPPAPDERRRPRAQIPRSGRAGAGGRRARS